MAKQLTLDTVQSFCKERGLKYEPTAAIQIANAAGIGCQRAKALWKDNNMSDENSLMKRFLKEENFNKP